jgi:hypothetical protein
MTSQDRQVSHCVQMSSGCEDNGYEMLDDETIFLLNEQENKTMGTSSNSEYKNEHCSIFAGYVRRLFYWDDHDQLVRRRRDNEQEDLNMKKERRIVHKRADKLLGKNACNKSVNTSAQGNKRRDIDNNKKKKKEKLENCRSKRRTNNDYSIEVLASSVRFKKLPDFKAHSLTWWKEIHMVHASWKSIHKVHSFNWDFSHLNEAIFCEADPLQIKNQNVYIYGQLEDSQLIDGILREIPVIIVAVGIGEGPKTVLTKSKLNGKESILNFSQVKLAWVPMEFKGSSSNIFILQSHHRKSSFNLMNSEEVELLESATPLFIRPSIFLDGSDKTMTLEFHFKYNHNRSIPLFIDISKDLIDEWISNTSNDNYLDEKTTLKLRKELHERIVALYWVQKDNEVLRKNYINQMTEEEKLTLENMRYYKFYPQHPSMESFVTPNMKWCDSVTQTFYIADWVPAGSLFCENSEFNNRVVVLDIQNELDGTKWREMQFGCKQLVQGKIRLDKDNNFDYGGRCGYIDTMATAGIAFLKGLNECNMEKLFNSANKPHMLFVGLGVGSLPNIFLRYFEELNVDVVEIDPVVVRAAKVYFGFDDQKVNLFTQDIRSFLDGDIQAKYDAIFLDIANENGLPAQVMTNALIGKLSSALRSSTSVLITNIFGKKRAFLKILDIIKLSFQSVHWLGCLECQDNRIVVSYRSNPIPKDELISKILTLNEKLDYDIVSCLNYGLRNGKYNVS